MNVIQHDPLSAWLITQIWGETAGIPKILILLIFRMVRFCDGWSSNIFGITDSTPFIGTAWNKKLEQKCNAIKLHGFNITNPICLGSKGVINCTYSKYAAIYEYKLFMNQHDGESQIIQNMIIAVHSLTNSNDSFWWDIKNNLIHFMANKSQQFIMECRINSVQKMMKKKCWLKILIDTQINEFVVKMNEGGKLKDFQLMIGRFNICFRGKYYLQLCTRIGYTTLKNIHFTSILYNPTVATTLKIKKN